MKKEIKVWVSKKENFEGGLGNIWIWGEDDDKDFLLSHNLATLTITVPEKQVTISESEFREFLVNTRNDTFDYMVREMFK